LRPFTVLLGIAMGSAVALLAGLMMTLAVFLLLPEYADRLGAERLPLFAAVGWALLLAVTSAAAFVGELRQRSWRRHAVIVFAAAFGGLVWTYWPSGAN
jgi:hypothetical protein